MPYTVLCLSRTQPDSFYMFKQICLVRVVGLYLLPFINHLGSSSSKPVREDPSAMWTPASCDCENLDTHCQIFDLVSGFIILKVDGDNTDTMIHTVLKIFHNHSPKVGR